MSAIDDLIQWAALHPDVGVRRLAEKAAQERRMPRTDPPPVPHREPIYTSWADRPSHRQGLENDPLYRGEPGDDS